MILRHHLNVAIIIKQIVVAFVMVEGKMIHLEHAVSLITKQIVMELVLEVELQMELVYVVSLVK